LKRPPPERRLLWALLGALLIVGLVILVVFTVRGGDPPRPVLWLLFCWVLALLAVVATLGDWLPRPRRRRPERRGA
jgi:peptidoglycan/LPS O-acetylase OafA/YrhL